MISSLIKQMIYNFLIRKNEVIFQLERLKEGCFSSRDEALISKVLFHL